ncbi:MAG: hypothetical protein AB7L17_21200 [Ilumatobacteraceae bacterium]
MSDVDRGTSDLLADTEPAAAEGLAVEASPDRHRFLFRAVVTAGIVLAAVLGIREVIVEPVIQLDDVRHSDAGVLPVQAQVLARNVSTTDTYCVEITLTVTDTDGQTLESKVAEPTTGDGTLGPGRSLNFVAVFDGLTQQEIDEELDDFFAFVTHSDRC